MRFYKCKKLFIGLTAVMTLFFIFNSNVVKAENTSIYTEELGTSYSSTSTVFRVWSDEASKVKVVVDDVENGEKDLSNVNGVWMGVITGDLLGKEYSYTVEYSDGTVYENVLDPYGKYLNSTLTKNVIYSSNEVAYEPWNEATFNLKINDRNKIIYGLNVVNYTKDVNSWNGTAENGGKLLGLIETSTKYNSASTGFDHLYNLGVTYAELYKLYDSVNPFAVNPQISNNEYSYSSSQELKQVVDKFYLKGIGISLSFDYRDISVSNFTKLDKDYAENKDYLDLDDELTQQYVLHLLQYWIKEYNLSGLRLDNMQDYSAAFVNKLSEELLKINSNLLIYGDGSYSSVKEGYATENNLANINNVRMVNGSLSYALLGDLFNSTDKGILDGNYSDSIIETLKFAMLSSVDNGQINYDLVKGVSYKNYWNNETTYELVNYLSSGEGLSIYDKLYIENLANENLSKQKIILAYMTMMASGGIPYIYAGDEFLASYISEQSNSETVCSSLIDLCFYSTREKKIINWNSAYSNSETVDAFRSFANFRKSNTNIQQNDSSVIKNNMSFYLDENKPGVFGYELKMPKAYNGDIEYARYIFNYSNSGHVLENVGDNDWKGLYNHNKSNREGKNIVMNSNDFYIEYKIKEAPLPSWLILIIVVAVVGGLYAFNVVMSKKLVEEKGYDIKQINRKYRAFINKNKINKKETSEIVNNEQVEVIENTENEENEKVDD